MCLKNSAAKSREFLLLSCICSHKRSELVNNVPVKIAKEERGETVNLEPKKHRDERSHFFQSVFLFSSNSAVH
jgi:hypothetical protein